MTVYDLNKAQIISLKRAYMSELDNEGIFGEIVYGDESIEHPANGDYYNADMIIPDSIIYDHYRDTTFSQDDFIMEVS